MTISKLAASSNRILKLHKYLMKIKIYCEAGAMTTEVKKLKTLENVELIGFPFESKNRKVFTASKPSELTCDNNFITADNSNIKVSDTERSEKFKEIAKIIGENHYNDVRHIDTAYKENCKIFISPDKGDIIDKAVELEKLTGIKFFHPNSIAEINRAIQNT